MQLGALCPTGWDNPGLDGYGTVAFLDGEGDALDGGYAAVVNL